MSLQLLNSFDRQGKDAAHLLMDLANSAAVLGALDMAQQSTLSGPATSRPKTQSEWRSVQILDCWLSLSEVFSKDQEDKQSMQDLWDRVRIRAGQRILTMQELKAKPWGLHQGLQNATAALVFLVMTRSRLPGKVSSDGKVESKNVLNEDVYLNRDADDRRLQASNENWMHLRPHERLVKAVDSGLRRLRELTAPPGVDAAEFWRSVVMLARIGLDLAEHDSGSTTGLAKESGVDVEGIDLCGSSRAGVLLEQWLGFYPAGLRGEQEHRLVCSQEDAFPWQNRVVDALAGHGALPLLVLNVADTGSGKTRTNARLAAVLRSGHSCLDGLATSARWTAIVNASFLSPRAMDAWRQEMGFEASGAALHEGVAIARPQCVVWDEIGAKEGLTLSLDALDGKREISRAMEAPVVLCTSDFVSAAADLRSNPEHTAAMLRLKTSDLVFEDVDSYEPRRLLAVQRLVTLAGFWGRHVVASSSLMLPALARSLFEAYALGSRLCEAFHGRPFDASRPAWGQAIVDDEGLPRLLQLSDALVFEVEFREHANALQKARLPNRRCPAVGVRVHEPLSYEYWTTEGVQGLYEACARQCEAFHHQHAWSLPWEGEKVPISMGLVRVANAATAIECARHLAVALPWARVACHHAQTPLVSQLHRDRTLHDLLNRKGAPDTWKGQLAQNDAMREALRLRSTDDSFAAARGVMLIVVSSPDIEVGQDLDFDWAVVEPSSWISWQRTAALVNRHRRVAMDHPNVGILQFNRRHVVQKPGTPVFCHPGHEQEDFLYPTHDAMQLANWDAVSTPCHLGVQLSRSSDCPTLASLDETAFSQLLDRDKHRWLESSDWRWFHASLYHDHPDQSGSEGIQQTWSRDAQGQYLRQEPQETASQNLVMRGSAGPDRVKRIERCDNDWLVLSHMQSMEESFRLGLAQHDALKVSVDGSENSTLSLHHDLSFGFFTPSFVQGKKTYLKSKSNLSC